MAQQSIVPVSMRDIQALYQVLLERMNNLESGLSTNYLDKDTVRSLVSTYVNNTAFDKKEIDAKLSQYPTLMAANKMYAKLGGTANQEDILALKESVDDIIEMNKEIKAKFGVLVDDATLGARLSEYAPRKDADLIGIPRAPHPTYAGAPDNQITTVKYVGQKIIDEVANQLSSVDFNELLTKTQADAIYCDDVTFNAEIGAIKNKLSALPMTYAQTATLANYVSKLDAIAFAQSSDLVDYLKEADAAATYLTKADGAATYQTIADMANYYSKTAADAATNLAIAQQVTDPTSPVMSKLNAVEGKAIANEVKVDAYKNEVDLLKVHVDPANNVKLTVAPVATDPLISRVKTVEEDILAMTTSAGLTLATYEEKVKKLIWGATPPSNFADYDAGTTSVLGNDVKDMIDQLDSDLTADINLRLKKDGDTAKSLTVEKSLHLTGMVSTNMTASTGGTLDLTADTATTDFTINGGGAAVDIALTLPTGFSGTRVYKFNVSLVSCASVTFNVAGVSHKASGGISSLNSQLSGTGKTDVLACYLVVTGATAVATWGLVFKDVS